MSDIGAMVEELVAAGTPPALAASVVSQAFAAGVNATAHRGGAPDAAAERRREADRLRQRRNRGMRLSESEWYPLVHKITKRDGGVCQYCGTSERLTADHVVPLSKGGTNDDDNLVCACVSCNSKKSNRLLFEWLPNPQTSADREYVSDSARAIILRETSGDVGRHLPTLETALSLKSSSNNNSKKERRRKIPCPPDWQPSEKHFAWAEREHIPHSAVLSKAEDMKLWAESTGELKKDWDATLFVWLRRDAPKLRVLPGGASKPVTPDESAIEFFKKFGKWHRDYGPEPGMPGCRVAPDILERHGYRKDAA